MGLVQPQGVYLHSLNASYMARRRRFFRFSIRSLGVATLLFAILLSWFLNLRSRHRAATRLKTAGVTMIAEPPPSWVVSMLGSEYGAYFSRVTEVDLSIGIEQWSQSLSIDEAVDLIAKQKWLTRLNVNSVYEFSDQHLQKLRRLRRLEELTVRRSAHHRRQPGPDRSLQEDTGAVAFGHASY